MVALSKKEARKQGIKGKGKQVAAPEPVVESSPEVSDEESDEDDDGIDEAGMARLMELVKPEDLNDMERAQLGMLGDDEDEDEDDEDVDEDEDDEEDDEDEDADEANDIIVDEADPDTLAVDELGSDISVDEDAVPQRKVTNINKPALRTLYDGLKMTNSAWPEHLILQSKNILEVDPEDDLKREMAFYKLALDAVPEARKLCAKFDIPFSRPNDYYAEMVKSDEHMERVRTKLVTEAQGIKKSEEAKKQRDLKKYGKQIQHEKLKQREQDKKAFGDKVQGIKRKRKDGAELAGEDDEFGIELEDEGGSGRGKGGARGGRADGKTKMPRSARDAKYSLGGSSRRAKQNTRESTNDIPGWNGDKKKAKQRPGKSRRSSRRN